MKTQRLFTALLFGTLALAAMAPMASADSRDRNGDSPDSRGTQGSRGDSRDNGTQQQSGTYRPADNGKYGHNYNRDDRNHRNSWSSRRTYYYQDPSSGRRSDYISDFKDADGNMDSRIVILQIDIRTGRQLGAFRYDNRAGHWRQWKSNRNGQWRNDTRGNDGRGIRGTGVYGGYPNQNH